MQLAHPSTTSLARTAGLMATVLALVVVATIPLYVAIAALIGPDGKFIGKYRKVTLPRGEVEFS